MKEYVDKVMKMATYGKSTLKQFTYQVEWRYKGEPRSIRFVANNEKGAREIACLFFNYIIDRPDNDEYEVFEEKE